MLLHFYTIYSVLDCDRANLIAAELKQQTFSSGSAVHNSEKWETCISKACNISLDGFEDSAGLSCCQAVLLLAVWLQFVLLLSGTCDCRRLAQKVNLSRWH